MFWKKGVSGKGGGMFGTCKNINIFWGTCEIINNICHSFIINESYKCTCLEKNVQQVEYQYPKNKLSLCKEQTITLGERGFWLPPQGVHGELLGNFSACAQL